MEVDQVHTTVMSEYVNKAREDGADRSKSHSPVQDHGEALSRTWLRLYRASGLDLVSIMVLFLPHTV